MTSPLLFRLQIHRHHKLRRFNLVRVQIHLPLAFHAHVVVACQHLLASKFLITNPIPSTSLTFALELAHLLMLSRPFQMLTFVHNTGLKITQRQCLHRNIIIRIQQVAHDFFDYFWNNWRPPDSQPTVVVAGPSCCHLSVAGKRLMQWDPRSSQGLETAKLAVHFKATILVIKNVTQLLDEDSQHGLMSENYSFVVSHGYNSMYCIRLQYSQLGGCTARERVFALWELADFAALLGPIPTAFPKSQPSNIRFILSPIDNVRLLVLPGVFEALPSHDICNRPIVAGSLYFGGTECPWLPGCSFTLPRILKHDKHSYSPSKIGGSLGLMGSVQVFDDVKRRPQFRWIHRSNLCKYNRVAVK